MKPLCPKCGSVLSQAEYHLSAPDYFAVCLECDEDFYRCEITDFTHDLPNILDNRFSYVPSAKTDINKTFAKYGYVPPSQKRESNAKAK